MTTSKYRRLARLESLAGPYIEEQKRRDEAIDARLVSAATGHVIRLAAVVHYGHPQIDEPLAAAWERAIDVFLKKFPQHPGFIRSQEDERLVVALQWYLLPQLPGETEKRRFQQVLDRAPAWLLALTDAPMTARILKLTCPSLKEAPRPGIMAVTEASNRWPQLPQCRFDAGGHPSPLFHDLTFDEMAFFLLKGEMPDEDLTRHERRMRRQIYAKHVPPRSTT